MDASPLALAPFSPDDENSHVAEADEFERRRGSKTAIGLEKIVHGRSRAIHGRDAGQNDRRQSGSVFDMSLEASCVGRAGVSRASCAVQNGDEDDDDDDEDEDEDDAPDGREWTLQLRRDDAAHLDDL